LCQQQRKSWQLVIAKMCVSAGFNGLVEGYDLIFKGKG
jgi:hypothetical protein